uniref:Late embryogenesis abundant protein LEA-2 subgroup domain-containing protein n=1 Tax=Oryza sativa subsp. japonica TaxID=39947 RepID=Q2R1Y2_ORYSJ|nr:hypothetical protein LOC_Os11g37680 [Oryza sativa Japonica Group]
MPPEERTTTAPPPPPASGRRARWRVAEHTRASCTTVVANTLCTLLLVLLLVAGVVLFVVWLSLRPHRPRFAVVSFTVVSPPATGGGGHQKVAFNVSDRNPNRHIGIHYDATRAAVLYGGDDGVGFVRGSMNMRERRNREMTALAVRPCEAAPARFASFIYYRLRVEIIDNVLIARWISRLLQCLFVCVLSWLCALGLEIDCLEVLPRTAKNLSQIHIKIGSFFLPLSKTVRQHQRKGRNMWWTSSDGNVSSCILLAGHGQGQEQLNGLNQEQSLLQAAGRDTKKRYQSLVLSQAAMAWHDHGISNGQVGPFCEKYVMSSACRAL